MFSDSDDMKQDTMKLFDSDESDKDEKYKRMGQYQKTMSPFFKSSLIMYTLRKNFQ